MFMTDETRDALNHLLGSFFGHNSEADNFAYNLAYSDYPAISAIYHSKFAHFFTGDEMADSISELMELCDTRAVREAVPAHDEDYNGNLVALFADNAHMCARCREAIIKTIETAELNNDYETKLFCEDLLMRFMPYYKQARTWADFAKRYENDYKSFNIHFDELTTYIK